MCKCDRKRILWRRKGFPPNNGRILGVDNDPLAFDRISKVYYEGFQNTSDFTGRTQDNERIEYSQSSFCTVGNPSQLLSGSNALPIHLPSIPRVQPAHCQSRTLPTFSQSIETRITQNRCVIAVLLRIGRFTGSSPRVFSSVSCLSGQIGG